MDFESARIVMLYVLTKELFDELTEGSTDVGAVLSHMEYHDEAYAELVANRDRHWVVHLLDFSEGEVEHACDNHWEAFS